MCLSQGGNAYEVVLLRVLLGPDNRLRSDCGAVDLSASLLFSVRHQPLLALSQISSCLPVEVSLYHLIMFKHMFMHTLLIFNIQPKFGYIKYMHLNSPYTNFKGHVQTKNKTALKHTFG